MTSLFVGNLSFQTTETELRTLFDPMGPITRVHIVTDRDTGQNKGFGFVELANPADATKAIATLNGQEYNGRALRVNEAHAKRERL